MTTDLNGLERKLDNLADNLTTKVLRPVLTKVGVEGKKVAERSVRSVLGDVSMSNWRRKKPIQIRTRFDFVGDTSIKFKPQGRSNGPMTVLEYGRTSGVSKKGRRYGSSPARGVWSDTTDEMSRTLQGPVEAHVRASLRKQFGGG